MGDARIVPALLVVAFLLVAAAAPGTARAAEHDFEPGEILAPGAGRPASAAHGMAEAAAEGDEALLEAVAAAVQENPERAQAIVDEATRLNPDLAEAIATMALAAGGEIEIAVAAGPAFPILGVLVGVGGAGGAAAAVGGGGGGGGGDGASPSVTPGDFETPDDGAPPPLAPGDFETPEYNAQEGLGLINASDAYARGLTGKNIVVAVVDTGLDVTHPEFQGQIAPGGFDFVDGTATMSDPFGHGTLVSGIIGARKDDVGMHGLAFDAKLLPFRIFDADGRFAVSNAQLAAAFDGAVANGAGVVNNSWGTAIDVTAVTEQQITNSFVEPEVLDAMQRTVDSGSVVVFAAGNASFANPNIEAGLPFHFPALQNLWVAVIALDLGGNLTSYTNRCGVAAAWCIAAPGGGDPGQGEAGVFSTASGGGYRRASGTSFTTPHVSGALAIILELFQGLTPQEAVERLFVSANGNGVYGDSAIFGHGLLDLGAATQPIGTVFVITGDSLSGPAFALDTTRIRLGNAFGDGLTNSLAGVTLAVFDSYNAPFYVDLGAFVQADSGRLDLDSLFQRFGKFSTRQTVAYSFGELSYAFSSSGDDAMVPGRAPKTELEELSFTGPLTATSELTLNYNTHPALAFGLQGSGTVDRNIMVSTAAFAAPYMSFAERGYNFATATELSGLGTLRLGAFFGETENEGSGESFGTTAELAVPVGERANLTVQLGSLSERETFLGSHTEGAFEITGGVPTYFGGVSGEIALSDTWRLVGSAFAGLSYPQAAKDSLFADVSPILTQSFTAGVVGDGVLRDGDRLGFLVNQPLRVTSGSAELALATGRDTERNVLTDRFTADLAPDGREIDVEAFYSLSIADHTRLTTSAMLRSEPGHIEGASPEGIFMLRFEQRL